MMRQTLNLCHNTLRRVYGWNSCLPLETSKAKLLISRMIWAPLKLSWESKATPSCMKKWCCFASQVALWDFQNFFNTNWRSWQQGFQDHLVLLEFSLNRLGGMEVFLWQLRPTTNFLHQLWTITSKWLFINMKKCLPLWQALEACLGNLAIH